MKRTILNLAFGAAMTTILIGGVRAQTPSGSEIQKRKDNQQDRIADGIESGQLTAGEAGNLEKKEAKLNKEIRQDRAANGGNLTSNEKQQINCQQNALSRQIFSEKHDAAAQKYGNNEVDRRRENQQDRIAGGIESGQLTAGEAAKLESQESKINQELRTYRKANGGNLTNKEKAQINRQQNRESARIYEKKHNAPHRPH